MVWLTSRARAQRVPLTHHEMLELVAPFARRGHRVDLRATDRAARRVVFKGVPRVDDGVPEGRLVEKLVLEDVLEEGVYRLERVVTAGKERASLVATGADVEELIASVEGVPHSEHFRLGPGFTMASSHRIASSRRLLTEATVRFDLLVLTLRVPSLEGVAARVYIRPARDRMRLPDDLLAVLGWDWSSLERDGAEWHGRLRLRGSVPERCAEAERKIECAAHHLARTLAEPPVRFHQRLARARWAVAARQALPLAAMVSLGIDAGLLPLLKLASHSVLPLAALAVPPTLLVLFLTKTENPRFGMPVWPSPASAGSW